MDTLNNIRPGDRINISFSDSKVNKNNYKSSISDLISDDTWEITMPMESGKMVLFPLGISCDLVIFSQGNIMNKCTAVIKDRYKKDGLFFLIIKISSKLTKIQRREFFRVVCCIDMQYYTLETNEKEINMDDLFSYFSSLDSLNDYHYGVIMDISGGGIKFSSDFKNESGSYILSVISLNGERMMIVCKIIACEKSQKVSDKYINRAKFIFKNISDREKIVRFVFDEERKARQREVGE